MFFLSCTYSCHSCDLTGVRTAHNEVSTENITLTGSGVVLMYLGSYGSFWLPAA